MSEDAEAGDSAVVSCSLFGDVKPRYRIVNGLRHVDPYDFVYKAYCKRRWVGRSLLGVFTSEFVDMDEAYYKNAIALGALRVNGALSSEEYVLKDNDLITHIIRRSEPPVSSEVISKIYEDDDILVVDKPSPLPVHPSGRYRFNTLVGVLMTTFGYPKLSLINRIDKSVSGVVIMAKNEISARLQHNMMSTRALSKQYLCRVHGAFPEHRIRVDAPIKLFEHRFCLNATSTQGRPSETIFERLWTNTEQSIIRALPITGRSHQIRVHLRHLGFPIVGDSLYGAETWPESLKPGMHPTDEQIELVKAKLLERKRQPAIFKCCKDCQESAYSQDITERIMLHAYSYSGPDWDFRSALPSWAKYVFSDPGRE